MNEQARGFFIVWNPQGRNPVFRHPTYDLAKAESIRLARENPGYEFIVMGAMSRAKKEDVAVVTFDTTRLEIPF